MLERRAPEIWLSFLYFKYNIIHLDRAAPAVFHEHYDHFFNVGFEVQVSALLKNSSTMVSLTTDELLHNEVLESILKLFLEVYIGCVPAVFNLTTRQ